MPNYLDKFYAAAQASVHMKFDPLTFEAVENKISACNEKKKSNDRNCKILLRTIRKFFFFCVALLIFFTILLKKIET